MKILEEKIKIVSEEAVRLLSFEKEIDNEFYYSNLPLCVIDSIFSIGVRYEGVKNVINKVSDKLNITKYAKFINGSRQDDITTSDFLRAIEPYSINQLSIDVFNNKQRTSTSNGILKAEAVVLFLKTLQNHQVERFEDVQNVYNKLSFETEIKNIKGQSSGISLKYFYMLAGNEDMIKPDRMIVRFLEGILGAKVTMDEAQDILYNSSKLISQSIGKKVSAMHLDNVIWNYQRLKK